MINRVFLDTNIVLDFIDKNRSNSSIAKMLFRYLILNDCEIVISEDMLTTIYYIDKGNDRVLRFLSEVVMKRWYVVPFGEEVINNALEISFKQKVDLEDILQCLCAKECGCDVLITNDKKFVECGITTISVSEFLKSYTEDVSV